MRPKNFFGELKRRNVYRVAAAYAVVAWLLIQIATQVFPFFQIPNWAVRLVVLLLIIGFPVALILAWAFELTPEGIKRTEEVAPNELIRHRTGRKIVAITLTLAVIAAGLLAFRLSRQKPTAKDRPASSAATEAPAIPEKSIAVLPFENLSSDKENAYFTEARLGQPDRAVAALTELFPIPYRGPLVWVRPITPASLQLDPMFNPLRSNPRFQRLVASRATPESSKQ